MRNNNLIWAKNVRTKTKKSKWTGRMEERQHRTVEGRIQFSRNNHLSILSDCESGLQWLRHWIMLWCRLRLQRRHPKESTPRGLVGFWSHVSGRIQLNAAQRVRSICDRRHWHIHWVQSYVHVLAARLKQDSAIMPLCVIYNMTITHHQYALIWMWLLVCIVHWYLNVMTAGSHAQVRELGCFVLLNTT